MRPPSPLSAPLALAAVLVAAGCHYPVTPTLERYNLREGYRFGSLELDDGENTNSNEVFVVLALSGGGTRAAALSYGVLKELDLIKFRLNPTTGEPCSAAECPSVPERSLLDEVDVISSVSGGSFTSTYYALRGREIFDPNSPFQTEFLYHPVQRDLAGELVFNPKKWKWLGSRVEIAADYHRSFLGDATFGDLRSRPYLILNSTDATTGGRFEFSQNQFDLMCADLAQFPLRRAVAASSAFPVLLNSMTIDSNQPAEGTCGHKGLGLWTTNALNSRDSNFERFRRAQEMVSYLDPERSSIHVLDGGVADNVGIRPILRSLASSDGPVESDGMNPLADVFGGWSLQWLVSRSAISAELPQIKKIVVIGVNARTDTEKDWDTKRSGPNSLALLEVAAGVAIGRLTDESTFRLNTAAADGDFNQPGTPEFYAFGLSFETIRDKAERSFFLNLGTNFELSRYEVDCLVDRGGSLLNDSRTLIDTTQVLFTDFVDDVLHGQRASAETARRHCTQTQAQDSIVSSPHLINVGLHYSFGVGSKEAMRLEDHVGLSFRIARREGLGASLSLGPRSFAVQGDLGGVERSLGDFRLWAATVGAGYTFRGGPVDFTPSVTVGYGFGSFELEDGLREAAGQLGAFDLKVKAKGSLMAQAEAHAWYDMTDKIALTGFAQYVVGRPSLELFDTTTLFEGDLRASGVRLGLGLGYRIY